LTGPVSLVILRSGRGRKIFTAALTRPDMSNIIDIEDRIKLEQKKKVRVDKAKKTEAVRKVVQCTRCMARCARCGVQFDTADMYKRYPGPYRLCAFCQEEYDDFLRITEKGQESRFYWHNREWVALWQSWVDYQKAMKGYGESPEFIDLVREVELDR
jgi:hypothetical protein